MENSFLYSYFLACPKETMRYHSFLCSFLCCPKKRTKERQPPVRFASELALGSPCGCETRFAQTFAPKPLQAFEPFASRNPSRTRQDNTTILSLLYKSKLLPYISFFISHRSLWVRAFLQSCAKYVPNRSAVHRVNCVSERREASFDTRSCHLVCNQDTTASAAERENTYSQDGDLRPRVFVTF